MTKNFPSWGLPPKLWSTKNAEIIAKYELKKRNKYAKYTINYGAGKNTKIKTFRTKKEAMKWIKKNKKYFAPTAVYLRREM